VTADVELYLQSLENELQQIKAPHEQWKTVLTPRLPSTKAHICNLQVKPEATYDSLKGRLLKTAGQTVLQAGQPLFELLKKGNS